MHSVTHLAHAVYTFGNSNLHLANPHATRQLPAYCALRCAYSSSTSGFITVHLSISNLKTEVALPLSPSQSNFGTALPLKCQSQLKADTTAKTHQRWPLTCTYERLLKLLHAIYLHYTIGGTL